MVKSTTMVLCGDIPRRACTDLQTPAEVAIADAMAAVEKYGADRALTDAVVLLTQARDKVADYVDRQLTRR